MKLCIAATVSAILYRNWLIEPALDYLTRSQWLGVATGVAIGVGLLWARLKWNTSTLVCGCLIGLLVGGTAIVLPTEHGSLENAFKTNVELFWGEMVILVGTVTLSSHCGR